MGLKSFLLVLCGIFSSTLAAPSPKADGKSTEISGAASVAIPPLLTFKDGSVGVNFLGFKASAGLGGLLTGDASHGGLHAEAETPFGQKAAAGLGGRVGADGRGAGGLYAGATAGNGVGAAAGLDGLVDGDRGSIGRSYAGASAGGFSKTVVKEKTAAPVAAGASLSGSLNVQKISKPAPVVELEVANESPQSPVSIEVDQEVETAPPAQLKKTYVERTVIPNYVEKTIQVPTFVEKTIRVPTFVEKRVKVEAAPTIIEKEVEVPKGVETVAKTKKVVVQHEAAPEIPPVTVVKTKTKFRRRPWFHYRKHFNVHSGEAPYYGGVVADTSGEGAANTPEGFGSFGTTYYGPPKGVYAATSVRKEFNGNLFRDIFNIPIATLGAVSNLVGNIAGGASGSVAVSKSFEKAYRK